MKFNLKNSARKNVLEFKSYAVIRDKHLSDKEFIFLDNCENNFGSPLGKGLERYPSSSQQKVKEAIAKLKKVKAETIVLGNGSDELIDLLIRAFCEPKHDQILISEPTFGMFNVYAQLNNVGVISVPLIASNFLFNEKEIIKAITKQTKLMFLCSPNNPTGTSINAQQVKKIITNFSGILVIDEAYVDFSEKESFITLTNTYKNLLVLQTFSKAWGLASLRLGMLIGNTEIIELINCIRPPFNISGYSQETILKAIAKKKVYNKNIKRVKQEKKILFKALKTLSFVKNISDSDANFFLIEVNDSTALCNYLLKNKILISNRDKLLNCKNHVRISIGTEVENLKLIQLLKKFK